MSIYRGGYQISIMELGALGEFVGAMGVILTLVYLAIQIRQNTRGIRASTVQAIQSAMNDAHSSVRNDLDSARVFRIGLAAQDLAVDELVQFRMLMYSVFAQFESIFFQKETGHFRPRNFRASLPSDGLLPFDPGRVGLVDLST